MGLTDLETVRSTGELVHTKQQLGAFLARSNLNSVRVGTEGITEYTLKCVLSGICTTPRPEESRGGGVGLARGYISGCMMNHLEMSVP